MKRIKGAIDRQIAEEQSKQKATVPGQNSASASGSTRRSRSSSGTKTQSPARRPRKKLADDVNAASNGEGPAANPDPAVFEAAFVIDDTDETATPSRVATPSLADREPQAQQKGTEKVSDNTASASSAGDGSATQNESGERAGDMVPPTKLSNAAPAVEIPAEVRARLRKLDKLEKTYPGSRPLAIDVPLLTHTPPLVICVIPIATLTNRA